LILDTGFLDSLYLPIMIKQTIFLVFLFPLIAISQHTIKGKLSPAEDYKWAVLYKVSPTDLFYKTDTKIDDQGNFTLELDATITKGMYRLVYAVPQDIFNFDIIYNGEEDIILNFNRDKGVEFLVSKENLLLASYEKEMRTVQNQIVKQYRDGYEFVSSLFETLKKLQKDFEKEAKGTIALEFIKANKPYIPESSQDIATYIKNNKKNYFKNIDVNNPTLQESSFMSDYAYNYIVGFSSDKQGARLAIEDNIDAFQAQIKYSEPVFQKFQWIKLRQKFVNENRAHTANYISENYLIPLAKSSNDQALIEELTLYKNMTLGNKAVNFSWEEVTDNKTILKNLHEIDVAQNYIIVFWSSGCSHCLKEVPKLHSKISSMEKGAYKVIAVGLEDDPYSWRNKIRDFPEFINVLGLGKWQNEIGKNYGVKSTPTYIILDKEKNIISIPEQLDDVLQLLSKEPTN
jgi:thioredoxin-related protein|tara:strand:- start:3588 stop:4964 length:1377 start_codon:yes stop_codon:yes gene_type:complete